MKRRRKTVNPKPEHGSEEVEMTTNRKAKLTAAEVQSRITGVWYAFIGLGPDHIKRHLRAWGFGDFDASTLSYISICLVDELPTFQQDLFALIQARRIHGKNPNAIPGLTSLCLGPIDESERQKLDAIYRTLDRAAWMRLPPRPVSSRQDGDSFLKHRTVNKNLFYGDTKSTNFLRILWGGKAHPAAAQISDKW